MDCSSCPISYEWDRCSSKEYGLSCETCVHYNKEKDIFTYGFMHFNGELEIAKFTSKQLRHGELRAHIDYMKSEGFTYMGKEV